MKELFEIFFVFVQVGCLAFGGGYTMLPLLQKYIADKRGWVTVEEITDYYAIGQCLPGIIAVNTAILIGHKRKGYAGMAVAALGMIFPSVVISLIIAVLIQDLLQYEMVVYAFNGITVAVLVLITTAVIKMWKTGIKDIFGLVIFAVTLIVMTQIKISPIFPILAGAVCGIVIKEASGRFKK